MKRFIVLFLLTILAVSAAPQADAQSDGPIIRTELDTDSVVPGQAATLRITVLAPTFLPSPPVWPDLSQPDLMIRLPERATGAVSESIDRVTWAGVSRAYRVIPLVPGSFAIPPQDVVVTWADPDTSAPRSTTLRTEAVTIRGVIPAGAEGLNPFIAATGLTLEQTLDIVRADQSDSAAGDAEAGVTPIELDPGDALTRTVVARIDGGVSMTIPPLMGETQVPGFVAYSTEPSLAETSERGQMSGSRTESVTYVAQGGGSGDSPAVSVTWFNLQNGEVETTTLDPVPLAATGPAPVNGAPASLRRIPLVGAGVFGALVAWLLWRRLAPRLRAARAARQARFEASEAGAWRDLQHKIKHRDYIATLNAVSVWRSRAPILPPDTLAEIDTAMTGIGSALYSGHTGRAKGWDALQRTLSTAREAAQKRPARREASLAPLNPPPGRSNVRETRREAGQGAG